LGWPPVGFALSKPDAAVFLCAVRSRLQFVFDCWVYPEVDDNIEIELIDKELRVDTCKTSLGLWRLKV